MAGPAHEGYHLGYRSIPTRFDLPVSSPLYNSALSGFVEIIKSHQGSIEETRMPKYNFERFFDLSPDMLCIASLDGYFKCVNHSFQRVLGWKLEELISQPFIHFVHPDDVAATVSEIEKLGKGISAISFQNRYRCLDGTYRYLRWAAFPEKETKSLFAVAHEITDLMEMIERLYLVVEASPTAMMMVNRNGAIQLVNQAVEQLLNYSRGDLIGKSIEMLVPTGSRIRHQQDRATFFGNPQMCLMGAGRYLKAMRRDGSEFPVEIGLNPVKLSDEQYVIATIVDLTLQKNAEEKLTMLAKDLEEANKKLLQLASTDRLTGLRNRGAFDEQLDTQIHLLKRMGKPLSLIMIDIDYFKQYNDKYGHQAGDEALKTVASLLSKCVRTSDTLARYGGEEFVIILPNTTKSDTMQLAKRLQMVIHHHSWGKKRLTISLGASTLTFTENALAITAEDFIYNTKLLSEADQALYYSKINGRDRAIHFSEIENANKST